MSIGTHRPVPEHAVRALDNVVEQFTTDALHALDDVRRVHGLSENDITRLLNQRTGSLGEVWAEYTTPAPDRTAPSAPAREEITHQRAVFDLAVTHARTVDA